MSPWREETGRGAAGRETGSRHGQTGYRGRGGTDLNENAQDSQALRLLSSLTQAGIGIRIVMYDVELRGEGTAASDVSPAPAPQGSDWTEHFQHALNLSHHVWSYPPSRTSPGFQTLPFPCSNRHPATVSYTKLRPMVPLQLWLRC